MQSILGAGGQIADELARELSRQGASGLRLVSRNPRKVKGMLRLWLTRFPMPPGRRWSS